MQKRKNRKKPSLILHKKGKKQYYRDPLKRVYRNVENPNDIQQPQNYYALNRMLSKVRDTSLWDD